MSRKVLGRGLESLIPGAAAAVAPPAPVQVQIQGGKPLELEIEKIGPNPFQPRTRFNDESLKELADSIRATGVIQPLLVRKIGPGDYQLVAGERRLRASHLAGLVKVPVLVQEYDDRAMMELALVENIQREDLNPIDEAKAYQALIETIGLTHEQLSERVGKNRTTITNSLRLLGLPVEVMDMVSRGTLTSGHARALLSLEGKGDQLAAARYVSSKGFSVRRTEAFVKRKQRMSTSRPKTNKLEGLGEWELKLQQHFATQARIIPGRKGGKVEFEFYSQEDLERLLEAWGVL